MSEEGRDWARRTVAELLEEARARLDRLTPARAAGAVRAGAILIDIRSEGQRERDGVIPGSRFVARNVLEWRCDPASPWRDPALTDVGARVIVLCDEGYQSSLAAATLHMLGLLDATDVIGGFQAWKEAGLPVQPPGKRTSQADHQQRAEHDVSSRQPPRADGAGLNLKELSNEHN